MREEARLVRAEKVHSNHLRILIEVFYFLLFFQSDFSYLTLTDFLYMVLHILSTNILLSVVGLHQSAADCKIQPMLNAAKRIKNMNLKLLYFLIQNNTHIVLSNSV